MNLLSIMPELDGDHLLLLSEILRHYGYGNLSENDTDKMSLFDIERVRRCLKVEINRIPNLSFVNQDWADKYIELYNLFGVPFKEYEIHHDIFYTPKVRFKK